MLSTLTFSPCMKIIHRCAAFDTSNILSLLEFCSLQAARSVGSWALSLLPGMLEGASILGSQIRAKGSIWLGRKEKPVLCLVAGKRSSEPVGHAAGSQSLNFFTSKLLSVVITKGLPSQMVSP